MYEKNYTIIDKNDISENIEITEKVILFFNIQDCNNIMILLDDNNYDNFKDFNPIWLNRANYFDLRDSYEELSPELPLKLMESQKYDHLIWISKRVCIENSINFTWTLSHEFRHLEQSLKSRDLIDAGKIIRKVFIKMSEEMPQPWLNIPTELDAELKAWQVVLKIFDAELVESYFKKNLSSQNSAQSTHFKLLSKYDPYKNYNVKQEIIQSLIKFKKEITHIQKDSDEKIIRNFDIDSVCRRLSGS